MDRKFYINKNIIKSFRFNYLLQFKSHSENSFLLFKYNPSLLTAPILTYEESILSFPERGEEGVVSKSAHEMYFRILTFKQKYK